MKEIQHFKVFKADAERISNESMRVRLYYPKNYEDLENRLSPNLSFGIEVFNNLISKGHSEIASKDNPITAPAAGCFYLFNDWKFVCHRRDKEAPTHKYLHGTPSGFLQNHLDAFSSEGITFSGLREGAEECLFLTKEKKPWLIIPKDAKDIALKRAKDLGISMRYKIVNFEQIEPKDLLEVYDEESGNLLFSKKSNIDFIYESQTVINVVNPYLIPFSSEEIIPVDAEGMFGNDGKFKHFKRESYVLDSNEIKHKFFGSALDKPQVYKLEVNSGRAVAVNPRYEKPYLGPGANAVTHPHIWAPNNVLTRSLDAMGVEGYYGQWLELELCRENHRIQSRSMISEWLPNNQKEMAVCPEDEKIWDD